MNNLVKKVIRASAGTGKTYRLSLEYIGLLLKFRQMNVHFSEILVITFTKKATAEIRERIFSQLDVIVSGMEGGKELVNNLYDILGIHLTKDDLVYLKAVYHEMLINKNQVQISTIDAFTHSIFKTIISPYLGLTTFEINNTTDKELLAEIYQYLLENEKNLEKIRDLFDRSNRRNIESYEKFITSLLNDRWIFHFIQESGLTGTDRCVPQKVIDSYLTAFRTCYYDILARFKDYLIEDHIEKPISSVLKKNAFELFFDNKNTELSSLGDGIKSKLENTDFILDNTDFFLKAETFWNGGQVLRKNAYKELAGELTLELQKAAESLADYLFYTQLRPEEEEIRQIAELVFQKYDEIKFRTKTFTYADISYYTFKYLYDPELSLLEQDFVSNDFYEYLSSAIRFILIDEFQDTSIIQFKILLPIIKEIVSGFGVKEYGGAIVVGDEKQSIYGWRGGERDLLIRMPDILGEPEQVTLDTSYRSNPNLIHFVNAIFESDYLQKKFEEGGISWTYAPIKAFKKDMDGCALTCFRNYSNAKIDNNNISQKEDTLREFVEELVYPRIKEKKIVLKDTAILARKNSDLNYIASLLDDYGVNYILESSNSVLQHRVVKPIMFLYRFLVYRDIHDLLRFLRSDYVLMDGKDLKRVLIEYRDLPDGNKLTLSLFQRLSDMDIMAKIGKIVYDFFVGKENKPNEIPPVKKDLLNFTKEILEDFNVLDIFALENDIMNLNLFLEIIAEFKQMKLDYAQNLKGFLEYCVDNESFESFQQVGLEDVDALNLMSIHKSKGLEFDNVFLYWDLSTRSGNSYGSLDTYTAYTQDYGKLADFSLIFNHNKILPISQHKHLSEQKDIKESIEVVNNFYVAMTRARSNLFLYLAYKKTGGLQGFLDAVSSEENPSIAHLLTATLYQYYQNDSKLEEINPHHAVGQVGLISKPPVVAKKDEKVDYSYIQKYMNVDRSKWLTIDKKRLEREEFLDFKSLYLKKKDIDKGNVVHYYLSLIKYASEEERLQAVSRTKSYYGNLFRQDELEKLFNIVDEFVYKNSLFYSPEKWTKVFTEYILFSPTGKEMRLDRVMVDEQNKEICVIDYKTGEIYEQEQLDDYIQTISSLPATKEQGYTVRGQFVEIKLDNH